MARVWQCGFELGSGSANIEITTLSGTASVQATTARTGTYALRVNPTAGTGFVRYHAYASNQNIVGFQRVYLRIDTLPSATTYIVRYADTSNNITASIRLTTAGKLQLFTAGGSQVGSDSGTTLTTGVWYCIELKIDATTTPGALDARLDGGSFASGANSAQGSWARVIIGVVTTAATADLYFDDWALNDASGSAQTSWCGEGKILHLVPNGDGDAHAWNNTANGAGASTNYQLVDEVPPNDATDYVRSVTLNAEDMYTMSDSGLGASDVVNAVLVGMRLSNVSADATTAVKPQVKKTASGTIAQGSAVIPNSTTWMTNTTAEPRNYPLTTYADPDGAAWTQTTLDSMQAGVKITAAGAQQIRVSTLWVSVDYTPSSGQTVSPTGIASGEAAGTAALSLDVAVSGIASAGAFGTSTVSQGQILDPSGIASQEALGTAALTLHAAPSGIASSEASGTAGVALDLAASSIGSAETAGTPALALTVAPGAVASAETFGAPSVTTGDTIAPAGIASAEAFGTALVTSTIGPVGVGTGEAIPSPAVGLQAAPGGVSSGEAPGVPALALDITAAGVVSASAFGTPTVATPGLIGASGISSVEVFGVPTIGGGAAFEELPALSASVTHTGRLDATTTTTHLSGSAALYGQLAGTVQ